MDEGADTGGIVSQEIVPILYEDDAAALYDRVLEIAGAQVLSFTKSFEFGSITVKPQMERGNSWRKRGIRDGAIDWRMSGRAIYNLVRALAKPYPGAHFYKYEGNHYMTKKDAQENKRFSVCVLTTTRADYGILRPLLIRLLKDSAFDLRIAVSGTHLSQTYGMTVSEIEADGFPIDCRISILSEANNTPEVMSRVMARTLEGFSAYFESRRPELLIVLGDRFETFAVCAAAVNSRIPIAHLHGGEATEGVLDECFRHAITKMSYLHFTSTETYRKRVIQLGEDPSRVFNVGAMGVENALQVQRVPPEQLEVDLNFPLFQKPYVVVTYHPVTLELESVNEQMENLLSVMGDCKDLNFLITKSNADMGGQHINELLDDFAETHGNCCVVSSLGMHRYMSVLSGAVCVMGNSSSGIIEAPSLGIPTINIGNRQRGRVQADSVINCLPVKEDILRALDLAQSQAFRTKAAAVINPYGEGKTSERICEVIKNTLSAGTVDLRKVFYDIPFSEG